MFSPLVIIVAVTVGLLLGLLGGGGSTVTVPLLVYGVGLDAKVGIATSLLVVGVASSAALVSHARSGNVLWRTGLLFGVAGMVGAYLGGRLAAVFPGAVLLILFAIVMFGSGVSMLRRKSSRPVGQTLVTTGPEVPVFRITAHGFVVGGVTGLIGAGGGFLVVPALVLLGRLPMHMAVGTSLLVIAMNSFAGLAGHLGHVEIDAPVAALVGTLAVVGTIAGSRVSRFISGDKLRVIFGCFVLLTAVVLLYVESVRVLCDEFAVPHELARGLMFGVAVLALTARTGWWLRGQTVPPMGVR